ncbi:hypothetical protein VCRA2118O41_100124 [Vibrio crassostreae]|nr:hypothetical protein VCRA2118O41_100124 [Vibrio crassostreae]
MFSLFTQTSALRTALEQEFDLYCQEYSCILAAPNDDAKLLAVIRFAEGNFLNKVVQHYFK